MQLITAVKRLRKNLKMSQQAFATELGMSLRAVANYEKDRKPDASALTRLVFLARAHGQEALAGVFTDALREGMGPAGQLTALGALASVKIPQIRAGLREVVRTLKDKSTDPKTRIANAITSLEAIESSVGSGLSGYSLAPVNTEQGGAMK